jgi:hypothetical protein
MASAKRGIVQRVYSAQDVILIGSKIGMEFNLSWITSVRTSNYIVQPRGELPKGIKTSVRYKNKHSLYTFADVCLILFLRSVSHGNSYSVTTRQGRVINRKGLGTLSLLKKHTIPLTKLVKEMVDRRIDYLFGSPTFSDYEHHVTLTCENYPWNLVTVDVNVLIHSVYCAIQSVEKEIAVIGI